MRPNLEAPDPDERDGPCHADRETVAAQASHRVVMTCATREVLIPSEIVRSGRAWTAEWIFQVNGFLSTDCIVGLSNDVVAFARSFLQPLSIRKRHPTAFHVENSGLFEDRDEYADRGSVRAQ